MKMYQCRHLTDLEDVLQARGVLAAHATIFTHQLEILMGLGVIRMADAALKEKIRAALKSTYSNDENDLVDVSDSSDGAAGENVHVVVVSRKFDDQRSAEKEDRIWSILMQKLKPEEWQKITLSIGISPEELKAI